MGLLNIIAVLSSSGTVGGTVGTLINAVSVDDYGAVGNGTTDDTAAFIAARDTGFHILGSKNKTYRIIGATGGGSLLAAFALLPGQKLIGEDRYTTKIKVTGNGRGIQLAKNSGVHNLTMVGAGISAGLAWNAGLVPYDIGCIIEGVDFTDFSGTDNDNGGGGIFGLGNTGASPDFKDGYTILNCDFYGNVTGLNLTDRSEFVQVIGGRYLRNTTAIYNSAGNNGFADLNIMGNGTGMKIRTGTNDGHGTVTNCRINHSTSKSVDLNGLINGFSFNGCHMYAADISVVNCNGIFFSAGSHLVGGPGNFTATNSFINISNCRYPKSPTTNALVLTNTGSTIVETANQDF